jgi:hypothetical protein
MNKTQQQIKNKKGLNMYEINLLDNLKVELDGEVYEGLELIGKIVLDNAIGNYRVYNMATGGIGTQSPVGNLLSKLGIE